MRRHLISASESPKEEGEGLSAFNCPRQVSQVAIGTSARRVEVEARAEVEVVPKEYSFRIVERCDLYDLNYCRSSVT